MAGAVVTAEDRGVTGDFALGNAITGAHGAFEIHYDGAPLAARRKVAANLVVRVSRVDSVEPLAISDVFFDAPAEASIDVEVPAERAPSEYERLRALVEPAIGDTPLEELAAERIAFVSGATGADADQLAALARAAPVARELGLPLALLYALVRRGLRPDRELLIALGGAGVERALDDAARDNLVPPESPEDRAKVLERVSTLSADALLRPAGPDEPASVGDVLATVLPDESERRVVVQLYAGRVGRPDAIGQEVRELAARAGRPDAIGQEPRELAGRAEAIETALEFAALTGHNLAMICELQQRVGRTRAGLRRAATLSPSEWDEVVQAAGPPPSRRGGGADDDRVSGYARELERAFEARFPTATMAARIADGTFAVPEDTRAVLSRFFDRNPDFELGGQPVAAFLADGGAALDGMDDVAGLRCELQRLERIVKVIPRDTSGRSGPRYRTASALRAQGLDSAQKIARLGRRDVVGTLAPALQGGREEAEAVHARALESAALALALAVKYGTAFEGPALAVLEGASPSEEAVEAGAGANLRTLFGNLDFCACEECQSNTSPAAYLVDVLQFLGDRALADGRTAKDVLVGAERRPDLVQIELSCENTNRRLPYVDLVSGDPRKRRLPAPGWQPLSADHLARGRPSSRPGAYTRRRLRHAAGRRLPVDAPVRSLARGDPCPPGTGRFLAPAAHGDRRARFAPDEHGDRP